MRSLVFSLALVSAAAAEAQSQLPLLAIGGSVPGTVEFRVGPFVPPTSVGVIMISQLTASIPLSVLDPADTRVLGVNLELASLWPFGAPDGGGVFTAASIPIPNNPVFFDQALYCQGTFVPGPQFLFGPLSDVQAIWFGPAASFRDRGTRMNNPRSFFPVATLPDGRVLIPGGGSGALLAQLPNNVVDIFDPVTEVFSPTFMTSARSLHTATTSFDDRVILIGGVNANNDPTDAVEIYDPILDSFSPGAPMTTPRMGHTATLLPNGNILVTGGLADLNAPVSFLDPIASTQKTTEIYNPFTDTWTAGPDMCQERVGHSALTLPDGRILLAGGVGFTTFIITIPVVESSSDIYDPSNNTMLMGGGPSMNTGRALFSLVELGGNRVLAAGGVSGLLSNPTNSAEILDATALSWTSTNSMISERALHAAYDIGNDRFLHIAGGTGTLDAPVPIDACEIYDDNTGQWTAASALPSASAAYGSYKDRHGQIHVLGGSDGTPGQGVVDNTWWYFP